MKLNKVFSLVVLLSLMVFISSSVTGTPVSMAARPSDIGSWQTGPFPPNNFQYARHDGAFVPGPDDQPWANKIYFPGGRTSPPTESPNIWMFDPLTGTYTDTGADVVEDVSNYNANLVLNDGTGRGPAVYVIGGTNKDGGGVSIGMVQRYYPQTNEAEALSSDDNWNGRVGGSLVAAMGTAVVDDIIYVYGGWETNVAPYFSSQTWAFDPNQPSGLRWTNLNAPLSTPRSYIMSAVQDGKVYAIGGVGIYAGGELDPVDTFEVLDTANLAAGWTLLAPMPIAGGEGRGFGFDSDTRNVNSPWQGKIYVVAANDWAAPSGEVMIYDIPTDKWRHDLPELPTPRADLAGTFVPLCTSNPDDGLPGLWTFGGRVDESCDPPLGPAEYYSLPCADGCIGFTSVAISGPVLLAVDEPGFYSATTYPADASNPVSLLWDNGAMTPENTYAWGAPGTFTVEITSTNCEGSAVVTDTLLIEVYQPLTGAEIEGPASLLVGETGTFSVTLTPPEATPPFDILWSNGEVTPETTYSWDIPGTQIVEITAKNGNGSTVVTDTLLVEVYQPLTGAEIEGPASLLVGETGIYSVTITPPDATLPFEILWSNGLTDTQAAYSWNVLGLQTVSVEVTNCCGTVQAPSFPVEVIPYRLWLPIMVRIEAR